MMAGWGRIGKFSGEFKGYIMRLSVSGKDVLVLILAFACAFIVLFAETCAPVHAAALTKANGTVTEKDGVIVRASWSADSEQVATLENKEEFTITKERFTSDTSLKAKKIWYYSNKKKGYVRSDLVAFSVGTTKTGHTTDSVNVRKGAGTSFDVFKVLKKNKKVTIVLKAFDNTGSPWYKVQIKDGFYYISAEYVALDTDAAADTSADKKKDEKKQDTTEPAQPAEEPEPAKKTGTDTIAENGFPTTYNDLLTELSAKHPNWVFKPLNTGLTWKEAKNKMTEKAGTNTIYSTFAYPFRSVSKGCYNYLTHSYTPKDGSSFYAASNQAVCYFMDPRNWMDDTHIFMFEDMGYHKSYQTKSMVKTIFKGRNTLLYKNAKSFVNAGKAYDINAIYLASKALEEQGGSVGSKTLSGMKVFNVFNIGACDSKNGGFSAGMSFARNGSSYLRPWTSVDKAVRGGAKYIAENFTCNGQDSPYLEHFNVMNGLSAVGTHVYMTAVYAPRNTATSTASSYSKYGIYDKKITFYIPVYKNMPMNRCSKPSGNMKKDNNFYLETLSVKIGGKTHTLISGSQLNYKKNFTVSAGGADSVKIGAKKASCTAATVSGTGTVKLQSGTNVCKVICKASSGLTRTYKITINN